MQCDVAALGYSAAQLLAAADPLKPQLTAGSRAEGELFAAILVAVLNEFWESRPAYGSDLRYIVEHMAERLGERTEDPLLAQLAEMPREARLMLVAAAVLINEFHIPMESVRPVLWELANHMLNDMVR